jgi:hypothetical protein
MATPFKNASGISYGGNFRREGVDEKLIDILERAAAAQGMQVEFTSGHRPGDKRQHGKGNALDITLIDNGRRLPNYQNAEHFRTYEKFAQTARQIQRAQYPELDRQFRWGGYFSGPKGKYGAMDTMHFDLAGDRYGMGGGSWERGLTKRQRSLFPGVQSVGFNDHPMPKVNIPDVASALSYAPSPQIISASLGGARANPPPLPQRRPNTAVPASLPMSDRMSPAYARDFYNSVGVPGAPATPDRSWMNDYGRVIGQHQPQRPTGRQASLGPPQFTNWQDDYNSLIAKANPATARPSMREPVNPPRMASAQPWNITLQPQFQNPAAGQPAQRTALPVPQGTAASVPQQTLVAREPSGPAPIPQMMPPGLRNRTALPPLPRPVPPVPPIPMPVGMRAAAETDAERMWAQTQFAQQAPFPATMSAALARSRVPQPMPAGMRPNNVITAPDWVIPYGATMADGAIKTPGWVMPKPQAPLNITVPGNRPPVPQPRLQRAPQAAAAPNGYVYALGNNGPVTVGTSRPRGMTPQQDYDRRAEAARRSSGNDTVSGVSWWG